MQPHPDALSILFTSETAGASGKNMSLEEQVAQWFREWRDPIYRYLVSAGSNRAAAEEITQECFLRLFKQLRDGKAVEQPQFWLYRVAHNLLIDMGRARASSAVANRLEDDAVFEQIADQTPGPEQIAMSRQRLARVHRSMQSLTELQRNCIYLRAEGFLLREISQILGVGISSVADALKRAMSRLAKEGHE